MDRKPGDHGRKKRVSGRSSSVHKGEKVNTGGPVGSSDGYHDRKDSHTEERGINGSPSGAGMNLLLQLLLTPQGRKFLPIVLILILVFGGGGALLSGIGGGLGEGNIGEIGSVLTQTSSGGSFGGNFNGSGPVWNSGKLNTEVSKEARKKRTAIRGEGEDQVTIMVYMCGTDLESKYGMATSDLQEMLKAEYSSKVNLIVETGGCKQWKNSVVSNSTNQIYQVTGEGLVCLEKKVGKKPMTDPSTLTQFIKYCKNNFPANRYELILWDHGGGSLSGYGYDELYQREGSMTLDEIGEALKNAECTFDFIGFDACLMATLETALTVEPYADYLIASEETEPGTGWFYTNWLTKLNENTSTPTLEIGKQIVDDFIASNTRGEQTTLSVIDLAELKGTVPDSFKEFSNATAELIEKKEYQTVSNARSQAREFAKSSQINQIDLIDFANKMGTKEAKEFAKVLQSCVKYNKTSNTMTNAYGISIYFPYKRLNTVSTAVNTYEKLGLDDSYTRCITDFANLAAGGQIASAGSGSPLSSLLGEGGGSQELVSSLIGSFLSGGDFSSITGLAGDSTGGWFNPRSMEENQQYFEEHRVNLSNMRLEQKGDSTVLKLSDEDWELMQNVELNVFLDDGEGFLDLGLDNTYQFDDDGDLIMDYDNTWLAINNQIVAYYFVSENVNGEEYKILGRIPAQLNGELVEIMVEFTNENPDGKILGAQICYDEEVTTTQAKGFIEIQEGDEIRFLCDYYSYQGEYQDSYYLGEPIVVDGELLLSNNSIEDGDFSVTYRLTDLYHNYYWSPTINQ